MFPVTKILFCFIFKTNSWPIFTHHITVMLCLLSQFWSMYGNIILTIPIFFLVFLYWYSWPFCPDQGCLQVVYLARVFLKLFLNTYLQTLELFEVYLLLFSYKSNKFQLVLDILSLDFNDILFINQTLCTLVINIQPETINKLYIWYMIKITNQLKLIIIQAHLLHSFCK